LRLHLQMTVHQWAQDPAGPTIQPQSRDVILPIMVSEKFVVPAGGVQDFQVNVTIPQGVYATVPGQIDDALCAVAPVTGQTIDSAQHLPLTIIGQGAAMPFAPGAMPLSPMAPAPMGAPFPAPPIAPSSPVAMGAPLSPAPAALSAPSAPPFAPGDDVEAKGPDQQWSAAMVVEARGPVLLVQWKDGRAAPWVRADQVRTPAAPSAPEAPPTA